jgi:nicotinamide-nucleotide amidase
MPDDAQLYELATRVGRRLLAAKRRMVSAESCTGGWIAKAMTDVPGSSQWFECGYVTYSNAAKMRDLGVSKATLDAHGAVSAATVLEMASGALRLSGADVAIAVSGIAGPDGGVPGKPVGTVWFASGFGVVRSLFSRPVDNFSNAIAKPCAAGRWSTGWS